MAPSFAQTQVECTNCSNDLELIIAGVGITLALVALVVSCWSLYATVLRRPKVEIERVHHEKELWFGSWSEGMPRQGEVHLWLNVANTGARGTVVDKLRLGDKIVHHGLEEPLFGRLERPPSHVRGGAPPFVLERGDAEVYMLDAKLHWLRQLPLEDFAERLRDLETITVTVVWSYGTTARFLPWKRLKPTESLPLRIEADRLRADAVLHWRAHSE